MSENKTIQFEPQIKRITAVIDEAPDVKTFIVDNEMDPLIHKPGQIALLTPVFGEGEIAISISSSPLDTKFLAFSIKKAGRVTEIMHRMGPGDQIGVRGPVGNSFPLDVLENKNLIFIGGGIGLAPLRSVINTVFYNRSKYKQIHILYGARGSADLVFKNELQRTWPVQDNTQVSCTIDKADGIWDGRVGFVPELIDNVPLPLENSKIITCGPPVMIKFVLSNLKKKGFLSEDIITTLEMKMKCGVGKCGRCNIGSKYVCVDGPVFTLAELEQLPKEY